MTRALLALLLAATAVPTAAETIAITGGTVALGDGSEPIRDGTVVIRDGRIVAAGGMKMKLSAGTQVIDATVAVAKTRLGQPMTRSPADHSTLPSTSSRQSILSTPRSPSIAPMESLARLSLPAPARTSSPGRAR